MDMSIVIPIYNESKNIPTLFAELHGVLEESGKDYEVIAVNDGSKDASSQKLSEFAESNTRVKVIDFDVNYGQTAALLAGIDHAKGDIIITMDSDLENDPKDILPLLKSIEEGFDVVSGWRKARWKSRFLSRKLPSIMANRLISTITGLRLHDYGCTLKAYKREVIVGARLYGEMHRFIPAYAAWRGARVGELPVNHRPRVHGKSNYGISRTFRVILDLIVIRFMDRFMTRPIHFFGGLGFLSLGIGLAAGVTAIILKIFSIRDFVETPLPVFSALFLVVGVQMVVMGILAEMLMRTYFESQDRKPYRIKEKLNF